MSAFDDEFGLFGDEAGEEEERRSTLGARKIASGETIIDEIEPEDERPARRGSYEDRRDRVPHWKRRRESVQREPLSDEVAHPRALELLTFLAKRLVGKPDAVVVELHADPRGAVLELRVASDDQGKVIGRGGRVAQALRTIVRAGAEGRVQVDIADTDEDDDAEGEPVVVAVEEPVAVVEPVATEAKPKRTRAKKKKQDEDVAAEG